MNVDDLQRELDENVQHYDHCAAMAKLDIVLAQARRRQAEEMDRLLSAGLRRCKMTAVSLIAPMFGWNRRVLDRHARGDREASPTAYVKAQRADAETGNTDRLLGHNA